MANEILEDVTLGVGLLSFWLSTMYNGYAFFVMAVMVPSLALDEIQTYFHYIRWFNLGLSYGKPTIIICMCLNVASYILAIITFEQYYNPFIISALSNFFIFGFTTWVMRANIEKLLEFKQEDWADEMKREMYANRIKDYQYKHYFRVINNFIGNIAAFVAICLIVYDM